MVQTFSTLQVIESLYVLILSQCAKPPSSQKPLGSKNKNTLMILSSPTKHDMHIK